MSDSAEPDTTPTPVMQLREELFEEEDSDVCRLSREDLDLVRRAAANGTAEALRNWEAERDEDTQEYGEEPIVVTSTEVPTGLGRSGWFALGAVVCATVTYLLPSLGNWIEALPL